MEEAATQLSRELVGTVPHVVGVSVRWAKSGRAICVNVDSETAVPQIPRKYQSFDVDVRVIGTPRFASSAGST